LCSPSVGFPSAPEREDSLDAFKIGKEKVMQQFFGCLLIPEEKVGVILKEESVRDSLDPTLESV